MIGGMPLGYKAFTISSILCRISLSLRFSVPGSISLDWMGEPSSFGLSVAAEKYYLLPWKSWFDLLWRVVRAPSGVVTDSGPTAEANGFIVWHVLAWIVLFDLPQSIIRECGGCSWRSMWYSLVANTGSIDPSWSSARTKSSGVTVMQVGISWKTEWVAPGEIHHVPSGHIVITVWCNIVFIFCCT